MKKIITLGFPCTMLFAFLLAEINVSCQKPTDCTVIVTVLDSASHATVPGAEVLLNSENPQGQVQSQGRADGSGNVTFIFKLPAIFDVHATTPTEKGTGIVQLQIGQTVNYTVYVSK